ncbi:hypothetical protein PG990_004209 [Apiospora arundinis]
MEINIGPDVVDPSQLPPLPASPIEPGFPGSDALPENPHAQPNRALSLSIRATLGIISSRVIAQGWCALCRLCNRKGELVLKAATLLALLITGISMWPSMLAASDGHKSELLAEWTARKDFIENCEAPNIGPVQVPEYAYDEAQFNPEIRTCDIDLGSARDRENSVPETIIDQNQVPETIHEQSSALELSSEQVSVPETPPEQDQLPEITPVPNPVLHPAFKNNPVTEVTLGQDPVRETVLKQNSVLQTTLERKPALTYRFKGKVPCWYCCSIAFVFSVSVFLLLQTMDKCIVLFKIIETLV